MKITIRFLSVAQIIVIFQGRSLSVIMSTNRTPFNVKERIFVALAWLPKGTLQVIYQPSAVSCIFFLFELPPGPRT